MRRSALSPFFSKASVRRLQPVIWEKVDKLLRRLDEFKNTGQPVRMDIAYAAFTNGMDDGEDKNSPFRQYTHRCRRHYGVQFQPLARQIAET